ncbi:hypothetical protein V8E55_008808 [Tylopilus felleus]
MSCSRSVGNSVQYCERSVETEAEGRKDKGKTRGTDSKSKPVSTKKVIKRKEMEKAHSKKKWLVAKSRRAAQGHRTECIPKVVEQVETIARQTHPVDNKASRFRNPAFRTFYDQMEKKTTEKSGKRLPSTPNLVYLKLRPLNYKYILSLRGATANTLRDGIQFPVLIAECPLSCRRLLELRTGAFRASLHPRRFTSPRSSTNSKRMKFVNSIKTAWLRWHSPILDDISTVKTWDKVNVGMVVMYQAKVLG